MKTLYSTFNLGIFGLADYMRGSAYLINTFAQKYNVVMSIMHPLRQFLKYPGPYVWQPSDGDFCCGLPWEEQDAGRIPDHVERLFQERDEVSIRTNFFERPSHVYPAAIKSVFELLPEVEYRFESFFTAMTYNRPFEVLHIRLDDNPQCRAGSYDSVIQRISDHPFQANCEKILLTNDEPLKEILAGKFPFLRIPRIKIAHTACASMAESHLQTLFEMKLITRAEFVQAYTTYHWGSSGFSILPALLYGIPYSCDVL